MPKVTHEVPTCSSRSAACVVNLVDTLKIHTKDFCDILLSQCWLLFFLPQGSIVAVVMIWCPPSKLGSLACPHIIYPKIGADYKKPECLIMWPRWLHWLKDANREVALHHLRSLFMQFVASYCTAMHRYSKVYLWPFSLPDFDRVQEKNTEQSKAKFVFKVLSSTWTCFTEACK